MLDAPICECSSTTPLVRCFPVASISTAPLAERFCPMALILPSFTQTSVDFKIPSASLVQTVAFLKIISCALGCSLNPNPLLGKVRATVSNLFSGVSFLSLVVSGVLKCAIQATDFPPKEVPSPSRCWACSTFAESWAY